MLAFIAAVTLAACGSDAEPVTAGAVDSPTSAPTAPDTDPDEGGFGPPVSDPELTTDATAYPVTGSVEVADNGCWYVTLNESSRLIVFPQEWDLADATSTTMRGPSGATVGTGDTIDGTVRFVHQGTVAADGKWGNYMAFCGPAVPELAVFDHLDIAFDPSTLGADDQRAAVAAADFTQHWPCGRGWAVSTADQRIGIMIHQVDASQPSGGPVLELPDPAWTAELVVGKHLFVSHCNDAIEEWVPTPVIAGRYPIIATIAVLDDTPAPEDAPALVRAELTNASISIDGTVVELGDLELRNESYNLFAG